jgi:hypothetical protein
MGIDRPPTGNKMNGAILDSSTTQPTTQQRQSGSVELVERDGATAHADHQGRCRPSDFSAPAPGPVDIGAI